MGIRVDINYSVEEERPTNDFLPANLQPSFNPRRSQNFELNRTVTEFDPAPQDFLSQMQMTGGSKLPTIPENENVQNEEEDTQILPAPKNSDDNPAAEQLYQIDVAVAY